MAGPSEIDQRGYQRRVIQFFHQSFQEYFAAQALRHGRGIYDGTGILDRLRQQVHELAIVEQKIESIGTGQKTEPVVAGYWQEAVRFCISDLDRKENEQKGVDTATADDAMLMLLPSHNTPAKEARALAVFALQCLAEEPDVKNETVYAVLDTAIDNLNELDGSNTKQNTMMDEAVYAVMQSRFGKLCHDRLLQSYIQARDARRNRIGCVFSLGNSESLNAENAAQMLRPRLETLLSGHSIEERVDAALQLVEAFYRPHAQDANARIDFLPNELLHETINTLLTAAEEKIPSDDSASTAAMWALGWLTSARISKPYATYTFTKTELERLRKIAMDDKRDAFARSWAALILSICAAEKPVFAQADWILEWAQVADGDKPQRQLPVAQPLARPEDIQVFEHLISSHLPIRGKGNVAIALGRLGHFMPEMVEPLLHIFENDIGGKEYLDEALVYLVLTGGSQVASALIQGLFRLKDDTDEYGLSDRCFLGLIGMGDVNALKHQLDLGKEDYISASAYALAGVADPQGKEILLSMEEHTKAEVRKAVVKALAKSTQWNSPNEE
ncbi:hypothetical protein A6770_03550 [Nostoc minutum NIES-26]|uniref:HEAT repeat domain-containing protein n=1 Tax=Nostoc minutum NIES-26 TaxID=1844469 RepID=A0A367QKY6_9NOSO|nr:hypothetical protein A6770_03550 [Nostoc minutum NIES-26]